MQIKNVILMTDAESNVLPYHQRGAVSSLAMLAASRAMRLCQKRDSRFG